MVYTSLSTGVSTLVTTENVLVTLNLKGPSFKLNLEGVTKDLTVSIKAKPAYVDTFAGEAKTFIIKNIEDSWKNTFESTATKDKKPVFKVDTATDIEEFLKISGAVVDLTISGDMASFFKLKGRKAGPFSFPAVSKDTSHTSLTKFDNFLVSVYNGKQLQFNYMPTQAKIDGNGEAKFPAVADASLGEFTMYQVKPDQVRFAIRGTGDLMNSFLVRDTTVTKEGASNTVGFTQ